MIIGEPNIITVDGQTYYRSEIKSLAGVNMLWFRVEEQFKSLVSYRTDTALLAMLIPAMVRGESIVVRGSVSEKLHYNLSGPLQALLISWLPKLNRIDISAEQLVNDPKRTDCEGLTTGVAAGFSAGVDSYSVLEDHFFSNNVPDAFRLSHLIYNNTGQSGPTDKLYKQRLNRLLPIANRIGLPLISVDSNLDGFYRPLRKYSINLTHTFRNGSVALLLQRGIGRFYYASGVNYSRMHFRPTFDASFSDVGTVPLLSTDQIDIVLAAAEYTRLEKIEKIAANEETYDTLNVCIVGEENCSACRKCLWTLLTLELIGSLNDYSGVFDLHLYRSKREKFIGSVLVSNFVYSKEIRRHMWDHDVRIPVSSWFYAVYYFIIPWKQVRRLKRVLGGIL